MKETRKITKYLSFTNTIVFIFSISLLYSLLRHCPKHLFSGFDFPLHLGWIEYTIKNCDYIIGCWHDKQWSGFSLYNTYGPGFHILIISIFSIIPFEIALPVFNFLLISSISSIPFFSYVAAKKYVGGKYAIIFIIFSIYSSARLNLPFFGGDIYSLFYYGMFPAFFMLHLFFIALFIISLNDTISRDILSAIYLPILILSHIIIGPLLYFSYIILYLRTLPRSSSWYAIRKVTRLIISSLILLSFWLAPTIQRYPYIRTDVTNWYIDTQSFIKTINSKNFYSENILFLFSAIISLALGERLFILLYIFLLVIISGLAGDISKLYSSFFPYPIIKILNLIILNNTRYYVIYRISGFILFLKTLILIKRSIKQTSGRIYTSFSRKIFIYLILLTILSNFIYFTINSDILSSLSFFFNIYNINHPVINLSLQKQISEILEEFNSSAICFDFDITREYNMFGSPLLFRNYLISSGFRVVDGDADEQTLNSEFFDAICEKKLFKGYNLYNKIRYGGIDTLVGDKIFLTGLRPYKKFYKCINNYCVLKIDKYCNSELLFQKPSILLISDDKWKKIIKKISERSEIPLILKINNYKDIEFLKDHGFLIIADNSSSVPDNTYIDSLLASSPTYTYLENLCLEVKKRKKNLFLIYLPESYRKKYNPNAQLNLLIKNTYDPRWTFYSANGTKLKTHIIYPSFTFLPVKATSFPITAKYQLSHSDIVFSFVSFIYLSCSLLYLFLSSLRVNISADFQKNSNNL